MAGQIKQMLERIVDQRSKGNDVIRTTTRTKLALKGLNPDSFTSSSEDDPVTIEKIKSVAIEFGITL